MSMSVHLLVLIMASCFLYYGYSTLFSKFMMDEFIRFGIDNDQRIVSGIFQLLGAVGLMVGLKIPVIGIISASGLCILMILGFATRLKVKDGLFESLPSFTLILLNSFLVYAFAACAT